MKKTDKIIINNLNDQIAQLFVTLKMPAANQTFQNQQKSPDYPSLSKYFLIANKEGTEKINGHPISARKEKSNPRENSFHGGLRLNRRTANIVSRQAACIVGCGN